MNLLLSLVLCLIAATAWSQMEPFLLLEKPGTKKRYRYYVGDELTFKPRYQKNFNTAVLVRFTDSIFYVNEHIPHNVGDIEALADRSKIKWVHSMGRNTLLAIPPMFLFSLANNAFNTGRRPLIDREVYYISGIFAVIGGSAYLYNGRRYRLDNRWRLLVIQH